MQATHYIDDQTDPVWDRTFSFIVAKPYTDLVAFRVYDYDGATSFDDMIGRGSLILVMIRNRGALIGHDKG